jgi:hypothetical protein
MTLRVIIGRTHAGLSIFIPAGNASGTQPGIEQLQ